MKEIEISLNDLAKGVRDLEAFKHSFEDNVEKFNTRLAEVGEKEAQAGFSSAQYDGTNDVVVSSNATKDGGEIEAKGQTVLFIEFGTGIYHNASESYGRDMGYGYGTYGPNGLKPYWFYRGNPGTNGTPSTKRDGMLITHGNPANKCMYNAMKELKAQAKKVAREVFR